MLSCFEVKDHSTLDRHLRIVFLCSDCVLLIIFSFVRMRSVGVWEGAGVLFGRDVGRRALPAGLAVDGRPSGASAGFVVWFYAPGRVHDATFLPDGRCESASRCLRRPQSSSRGRRARSRTLLTPRPRSTPPPRSSSRSGTARCSTTRRSTNPPSSSRRVCVLSVCVCQCVRRCVCVSARGSVAQV